MENVDMENVDMENKMFKVKMWSKLLKDTVDFIKVNIDEDKKEEAKLLLDFLVDSSKIYNS